MKVLDHYLMGGVVALLFALNSVSASAAPSLLEMSDKFDKADQQDFVSVISKARRCIQSRDFSCSEQQLEKAGKLVTRNEDRKALANARQELASARQKVEDERIARERAATAAQQSGSSSSGSSPDYVMVDFDVVAGFSTEGVDREFSMSAVDSQAGRVEVNASRKGATIFKSYNGALGGNYRWNARWDRGRKGCSGTVSVSGRKQWLNIRVYSDCKDAGTNEF